MRVLLTTCLLWSLSAFDSEAAAEKTTRINDELTIRRVAAETFIVVHEKPFAANSVVAKMPDGTLVIVGSPYDPIASKALITWLRSHFDNAPMVLINTHFHFDGGSGGNQTFLEAGAKVYGSDLTARLLRERGEKLREGMLEVLEGKPELQKRFASFIPQPPKLTFPLQQGLTLKFGDEEVQVRFPGHAHAPDNVVVWFSGRGILVGGCAVVAMPKMGYVGDTNFTSWNAALKVMRRFKPGLVIPGHEQPGDASLLEHTQRLIDKAL